MTTKLRNMTSIYIKRDGKFLLLYRIGSRVVPPSWCGIGGHFERDELNKPYDAMLRELSEECGLAEGDLVNIRMRYVTLRLKGGEIRQNYYYFADLREGVNVDMDCEEGELRWVEENALPFGEMSHTAEFVLRHYMEVGRHDALIYTGTAVEGSVVFCELSEF